jgi:putative selenium metabolism protein SsnA
MLITNGTVLTFGEHPQMIPGGAIYIEGDIIAAVGSTAELSARYPNAEVLDAGGKIVMPGLICAHTHFYGAFARGMAIPGEAPANFMQILERLWWKIDRALTLEDSYLSAMVLLVDAIRHGTTTLIDHHASPNAIDGSLDALADAVDESGLRACLSYEVTDRNGKEGARAGIAENVRFIKRLKQNPHQRLAATFGLHASFTVSDQTLAQAREAVHGLDTGYHIHVAEDKADQTDSLKKYGVRVVERLEKQQILGPKSIAAHCIHIDAYEMDILRATQTNVTHQPRSNMNNAVGVADVPGMLHRDISVSLGNDGFYNNMFVEMHVAYLLQKIHTLDPRTFPGNDLMKVAFDNNTHLARVFWPKTVGVLEPGAYADIILLDYVPFTPLTEGNYPWQIVFGMDGSHVTHTIASGKLLMKDRQLLYLDEKAIAARAMTAAKAVWQRVNEL